MTSVWSCAQYRCLAEDLHSLTAPMADTPKTHLKGSVGAMHEALEQLVAAQAVGNETLYIVDCLRKEVQQT